MIQTVHLHKTYRPADTSFEGTIALRDINLSIQEGEFVSIMGPSGCGKSTLLNLLALMDKPTSGEILLMNVPTSSLSDSKRAEFRRKHLGFVFQQFNLIDELSIYENVELPLMYLGLSAGERRKRVNNALERLGIIHKSPSYPQHLSGGHQQRVALARAIVGEPQMIFADEPTGNLDSANGEEVMNILLDLNEAGTTVIMVTHSLANTVYSQRTLHLFDGQIVSSDLSQLKYETI